MAVNKLIRNIAEYEYSLFVVNTYAAGIQQDNGRYLTRYIPISPFVIENMLLQGGSMGCYQQGYKTNRIKWICFDFDCKELSNSDLLVLFERYVVPFTLVLEENDIRYLTEFSGRRGIHVWIVFDTLLTKALGFQIVHELEKRCPELADLKDNIKWGLDRFPATDSSKRNVVGKQVKFPLSYHRSGSRSYFFTGEFCFRTDTCSEDFLRDQLDILQSYVPNRVDQVVVGLNLEGAEKGFREMRYRKYRILGKIEVTTDQVMDILSETDVFDQLFQRMKKGLSRTQDWTVLLGTLSVCDANAELLESVFQRFPNYDQKKTYENIKKLKEKYFPATFGYLYRIYDMPMESWIDASETGLHYLLRRCGVENQLLEKVEYYNETRSISDISVTVTKEKNYLKDNDEVADAAVWNQLCNLNQCDLQLYDAMIEDILNGDNKRLLPEAFQVYDRIESPEKTRRLVSLSARDRVITTHLALKLCNMLGTGWDSFSYHVSYLSQNHIFYYWYSSWGKFMDHIRVFTEISFMDNFQVFYLDLKSFYDQIDFLTVYRTFENVLDEQAGNIFFFLIEYNDRLMKEVNNGRRIGVPQGPAYARIIAEMFLDRVLEKVYARYDHSSFYTYRYVDDIVIFCSPDMDGKAFYEDLKYCLQEYGLPVNQEKSRYFGEIRTLGEEEKGILLHKDSMNYDLNENDFTGTLLGYEKKENLRKYLMEHPFCVGSLGYIFGKQTITEAQTWCIEHYRKDILESREGRGNNFRKFYYFLFRNEDFMELILNSEELFLIPTDSINFSNFIHSLYFSVQDRVIEPKLFYRIKGEYLGHLQEKPMNMSDRTIVNALLMIEPEVTNEKD